MNGLKNLKIQFILIVLLLRQVFRSCLIESQLYRQEVDPWGRPQSLAYARDIFVLEIDGLVDHRSMNGYLSYIQIATA